MRTDLKALALVTLSAFGSACLPGCGSPQVEDDVVIAKDQSVSKLGVSATFHFIDSTTSSEEYLKGVSFKLTQPGEYTFQITTVEKSAAGFGGTKNVDHEAQKYEYYDRNPNFSMIVKGKAVKNDVVRVRVTRSYLGEVSSEDISPN